MLKRIIENIIGLVFIVSAITKLYDFSNTINFLMAVTGFNFNVIKFGLIYLLLLEIAIGISFIINFWHKPVLFYSIFILIIFFVFVNFHLFMRGYANCGCFGTQIVGSPLVSLSKNVLIAVYLLYAKYSIKKIIVVVQ
jgi:hypothetical protein